MGHFELLTDGFSPLPSLQIHPQRWLLWSKWQKVVWFTFPVCPVGVIATVERGCHLHQDRTLISQISALNKCTINTIQILILLLILKLMIPLMSVRHKDQFFEEIVKRQASRKKLLFSVNIFCVSVHRNRILSWVFLYRKPFIIFYTPTRGPNKILNFDDTKTEMMLRWLFDCE